MLLRLETRRALARSDRTRDVASSPIRAIRAQSLLSSDFLRFVSSSLDSGPKLLLDRYKKGEGPVPISKDQKRGFFVPFAGSRIEPLIQELVSPLMKEGWRRKREAEADTQNAKVPVCAQRRRPGCGCVADICPARAPQEPRESPGLVGSLWLGSTVAPSSGTEGCRCRLLLTLAWRDWRHAALRLQQVASVTVL